MTSTTKAERSLAELLAKPIAHRGLHNDNDEPENSIAAFKRALAKNFPIEFDVQCTADGEIVVFHDYDLSRMTKGTGKLSEKTLEYLQTLQLAHTGEKIPRLSDVLELVSGKVPLLIEIKNEDKIGTLEEKVGLLLESYSGSFAIQSFNPFVLSWFRKNHPNFCRGQLSGHFPDRPDIKGLKKLALKNLWLNIFSKPHFVAYDIAAGDINFHKVQKKRLPVPLMLWTINTKERWETCVDLGVNAIFENIHID